MKRFAFAPSLTLPRLRRGRGLRKFSLSRAAGEGGTRAPAREGGGPA
ncbi:hypothetical protein [Azospirillum argentinense]